MDPTDPMRLFACASFGAGSGDVQLSTDGGASWTDRSRGLPPPLNPIRILMDPDGPDRLAIVYRQGEAYRSDDAGLSWRRAELYGGPGASGERITSDVTGADWDPVADRFALATRSQGALISDRGFLNDGLPTERLTSILFVPGGDPDVPPPTPEARWVVAGTENASVYTLDLAAPEPIPFRSQPRTGDPHLLVRPNPSRRSVQVELTLPAGSTADAITIYDVRGRRVATLASGIHADGTFVWDGRDEAGERVGGGIYFVRLELRGETVTRKVVFLP
jgi:hypothetical protein